MDQGLGELKVLLVDDNEHMRAIVGTILKGIGIVNLREARDGSEALEALRTWPADIAIVDFRMEPMDGVDLTRLVRNAADSRNPFLPIIMMTGFADRPRVEEARDSGVTELIVKPVTARAIIDRLNAVVYRPRPFFRTPDYFGPQRRGIDDVAVSQAQSSVAHI
jgi:CheY-like chemotaxis protein